jgi:antitoxin YefM
LNLPVLVRGFQAPPDRSELISQARCHFSSWGGRCEDVFRYEADPARFLVVLTELVACGPKITGHRRPNMYNILYSYGGAPVDAITYTAARANLADTMDRVCEDHEAIIITRSGQQAVVMMSLDDFKALEETSYLLRSPKNARRLLEAIAGLEEGHGKVRKLAE